MYYNRPRSLFAGMQTSALQKALDNARQAYLDLATGAKGESYSYTQGDGSKAVTYTKADLVALDQLIRNLDAQLNGGRARRAIVPRF